MMLVERYRVSRYHLHDDDSLIHSAGPGNYRLPRLLRSLSGRDHGRRHDPGQPLLNRYAPYDHRLHFSCRFLGRPMSCRSYEPRASITAAGSAPTTSLITPLLSAHSCCSPATSAWTPAQAAACPAPASAGANTTILPAEL